MLKSRDAKGKELESVESVAVFNQSCEETRARINEKLDQLKQTPPQANDINTLQVTNHNPKQDRTKHSLATFYRVNFVVRVPPRAVMGIFVF